MANLNNSIAYGFSKNVCAKTIIKTLREAIPTAKVSMATSAGEFQPIAIDLKSGRKRMKLSVVVYYNNDSLALSLYNMMYSKYITFIANNNCYIVNSDTLRENWNNVILKTRNYTDGSKVRSEMTYADIEKVKELAESYYPVDIQDMLQYNLKAAEYGIFSVD